MLDRVSDLDVEGVRRFMGADADDLTDDDLRRVLVEMSRAHDTDALAGIWMGVDADGRFVAEFGLRPPEGLDYHPLNLALNVAVARDAMVETGPQPFLYGRLSITVAATAGGRDFAARPERENGTPNYPPVAGGSVLHRHREGPRGR